MKGKLSFMWRATLALVLVLSLGVVMAVPVSATPDVTITEATGGEAISADTGGTTPWTALTGPVIAEGEAADIGTGSIILRAPSGFEFNTGQVVTATVTGGVTKLVISDSPDTPLAGTITFTVSDASITNPSTITLSNIQVRPTEKTPLASGNIVMDLDSTSTIAGVTLGYTSFGTLTEVTGAIAGFTVAGITDPIPAGTASDVTVTAVDQGPNTLTDFTGEITFSSIDTKADLPANYTFTSGDAGTKTFTDGVTLLTEGEMTVTAAYVVVPSLTGTQTAITVEDPTDIWVDDDWTGTTAGTKVESDKLFGTNAFATIQTAIGAASASDTISVAAGTYAENVVIGGSLDDLTLKSIAGAATTTIDASAQIGTVASAGEAVEINSVDGVTLGGDGVGFTIIAPDATEYGQGQSQRGVVLFGPDGAIMNNVKVEGNTIKGSTNTGSDSPQIGIYFWGSSEASPTTFTGITIKDNILTTTYVTEADWARTSSGITASSTNVVSVGGTFEGNNVTGYSVGIDLDNALGADANNLTTLSLNTVSGNAFNGIELGGGFVEISGNTVSGNGGNGIAITAAAAEITVSQNDIHGNGNGVKVYDGVTTVANVSINYNDIYDNTNTLPADLAVLVAPYSYENYGVLNEGTGGTKVLDAQYNFWSDPSASPLDNSGPDSATYTAAELLVYWEGTALGTGDIAGAVLNSSVDYEPWLTVDYATAYTDNIRFYAATYTLQEGWNTLSVPLTLKADADTLTQILAMGDYIISTGASQNYAGGYSFDSGTWVAITGAYKFEPCKAVYVKMLEDAQFPMAYSGQLGLPSQTLSAGWNLIGSAFGIDRLSSVAFCSYGDWGVCCGHDPPGGHCFGQSEENDVAPDIESYKSVTDALDSIKANASVVVSPSVPGQELAWSTTIAAETATNYMIVGEGYWVFMTAPDITYAGFEVTPLYFVDPAPAE